MRFNMSMTDIISSPVRLKVAKFLLSHEAPMSEREIASILKISHMSVNRAIIELGQINFVHYKVIGNAHVWTVNRKSYAYQALSKIVEVMKIYNSPLTALKEQILEYLPKKRLLQVILFGSISRNEDHANSDIDLLIVVKADKDKDNLEMALEQLSSVCIDMFGNRLAPYVLTEKEWKAKKSLGVIKEAQKGVKLYESKV